MPPEQTIGNDYTFGAESLIFRPRKPPALGVATPCYVMLCVDLRHHAMPCNASLRRPIVRIERISTPW
eukprot:5905072-Pyramimonas_sp.AAC.1